MKLNKLNIFSKL